MADKIVLREVTDADLPIFFEQQLDPDAVRMAAFPPRDRDAFTQHWAKIRADESVIIRTILFDGRVAGNIGSFERDGRRQIGYWLGKSFWGRGIATGALSQYLGQVPARPLYAYVAEHNVASIRVLEKCGFAVVGRDEQAAPTGGEAVEDLIYRLG